MSGGNPQSKWAAPRYQAMGGARSSVVPGSSSVTASTRECDPSGELLRDSCVLPWSWWCASRVELCSIQAADADEGGALDVGEHHQAARNSPTLTPPKHRTTTTSPKRPTPQS